MTATADEQESRIEVLRDVNFMSLNINGWETDDATKIKGVKLQRWVQLAKSQHAAERHPHPGPAGAPLQLN